MTVQASARGRVTVVTQSRKTTVKSRIVRALPYAAAIGTIIGVSILLKNRLGPYGNIVVGAVIGTLVGALTNELVRKMVKQL